MREARSTTRCRRPGGALGVVGVRANQLTDAVDTLHYVVPEVRG